MSFKSTSNIRVSLPSNYPVTTVGTLLFKNRRIYFEYNPLFLKSGFSISPFKLPLVSGVHTAEEFIFEGLFGRKSSFTLSRKNWNF